MRLLLDTHLLLWTIFSSARLPPRARDMLLDPDNSFHVSVASIWEISIKRALSRAAPDAMPAPADEVAALAERAGFALLPILAKHAAAVENLPATDHADPFDRLLVAQALTEPMHLLTHDRALSVYGDHVMVV